ncbi:MAG: type II toxin-antitoxin system YafQ family toxin [Methanobrevibacter sp.]|nr:type II toxin-antitoxin system YafQ family toxin [Methanobrevibacter sp.]
MLKIKQTSQFKKDLKAAIRQNCDLNLLEQVIDKLAKQEPLDKKHRDHALTGKLKKYRECHITSDWLLMYQVKEDVLILSLARLGSHAKLLGM